MSSRKKCIKEDEKHITSQKDHRWLVHLLVTLILVTSVGYFITCSQKLQVLEQPSRPYSIKNVARKKLLSPDTSYRDIAEWRVPLILTNTIANQWKAGKTFTTSFLAEKLPQVSVYSQDTKRSFITFHDNKPLEPFVLDEKWEDFNIKINSTIPELLRWNDEDISLEKGPWKYFSQDVTQLITDFPDILDLHIKPIQPLILSKDNVQINLWIGRKGIITHTHYDATYNFFVQLQGRKRFTLFPPNQTLYLYPCLHPHYGHSQVDILNPLIQLYPLFEGSEGHVAEVGPGDMLVVPPYWYHHVETMEESVSVNVWSDAPEYALMNEIYEKSIPFDEDWGWPELTRATFIYTKMILEAVGIEQNYRSFIYNILNQRYQPLVSSNKLLFNESLYQDLFDVFHTTNWKEMTLHYVPLLKRGLAELKPLFNQIPGKSTLRVCVGNYVEHLVHRVIGLEYVYHFLVMSSRIWN